MAKTEIKVNIDADLKRKASKVLQELGVSEAEAIRRYYDFIAENRKLPFEAGETAAKAKANSGGASRLDESWQKWVGENLERKCDPREIADILLNNNFSLTAIRHALGSLYPYDDDGGVEDVNHEALSRILITQVEKSGAVQVDTGGKVQLYTLDGFMTPEECDRLVAIVDSSLRPSTVTYDSGDKYFRTSSTSDLVHIKNDFITEIDQRIADVIGINLSYSEGIQAQKYLVGQEFKAHTDYFQPGTEEYKTYADTMGNRTWTFMVYLNDTLKGGGTGFINVNKVFYPKKGSAVIWNNLKPSGLPNPFTLHSGMPVEEGEKIVITKWFREKGIGKMIPDA